VNAAVYNLEQGELCEPGDYLIQIRTQTPIIAGPGDHFILRSLSPMQTVGGGTIVEAVPRRLKRTRPNLREELQQRAESVGDDARFVEYCIRTAAVADGQRSGVGRSSQSPAGPVAGDPGPTDAGRKLIGISAGRYLHRDTADEACRRVLEIVQQHHRDAPDRPGMTWEELKQATRWDKPVLDGLIVILKTDGRWWNATITGAAVPPGRVAGSRSRLLRADRDPVPRAGVPTARCRGDRPSHGHPQAAVEKTLKSLREHGRLIWVGQGLYVPHRGDRTAQQRLIEHIRQEGCLESVKFKYLLDTTRKYALPLLDYFDRTGLLRRDGNTRYLK
jgi:selenocysteine-specific elongation factor